MNTFLQSPFFNFVKKLAAGSVFCAVGAVMTPFPKKIGDFQGYVEKNLESIIKLQEENLGIDYPEEERPRIYYQLPEHNESGYGLYDHEKNEIFFMNDSFDYEGWDRATALDTIHHELAHWYCDSLSERKGKGNWPGYNELPLRRLIPLKLLSEGIATYIEERMNGSLEDTFSDDKWPKNINEFFVYPFLPTLDNRIIYSGGFHLVRPIIDLYGQRGIEYLMFNPPLEEELLDLPSYQQRILQELSTPI